MRDNIGGIVLALALTLTGSSGCKDKVYPVVPISHPDILQAVNFRPGSYFIYQDSATGAIDSCYVHTYRHGNSSLNPVTEKYYEYATYEASLTGVLGSSLEVSAGTNVVGPYLRLEGESYSNFSFFTLPFPEGTEIEGYHPVAYLKYYPVYSLGNVSYTKVYEEVSDHDLHSFYSVDSGLIKFSLTLVNGEYYSWSLIREKIVR